MLATQINRPILIVDRDVAAVEPLRHQLSDSGFNVRIITDGVAAAAAVAERPPHLMIIDWNMPDFTALDLIQGVRNARCSQPVRLIILSELVGEQNIVAGLNFGADDYIAKPFSVREVMARVCAVLRSHPPDVTPDVLSCDGLVLDSSTNRLTAGGRRIDIRRIEYRLLEFLMANIGRTFNRTQLLRQVWGDDAAIDERTVDVNVQRLRKILSACGHGAYLQTVRGFGYRFASPQP